LSVFHGTTFLAARLPMRSPVNGLFSFNRIITRGERIFFSFLLFYFIYFYFIFGWPSSKIHIYVCTYIRAIKVKKYRPVGNIRASNILAIIDATLFFFFFFFLLRLRCLRPLLLIRNDGKQYLDRYE
jgi:hypothetical protein